MINNKENKTLFKSDARSSKKENTAQSNCLEMILR